ncbi:hypothetical protein LINPERHAP1_LOCUS25850, partial [Linum perenne]
YSQTKPPTTNPIRRLSPTVTRPQSIDKSIKSDTRILSTLLITPPGRIPLPKQIRQRVYSPLSISPRYSSDEFSQLGISRSILK